MASAGSSPYPFLQEHYMKKLLSLLAAAGLALSFAAHAADAPAAGASAPSKAPTAQQSKMAACNAEAGDKKGDERKAFMKECLSANKQVKQQDKMKRSEEHTSELQSPLN